MKSAALSNRNAPLAGQYLSPEGNNNIFWPQTLLNKQKSPDLRRINYRR